MPPKYRSMMRFMILVLALPLWATAISAGEPSGYEDAFPVDPDPFMGNWTGQWLSGDKEPEIAAQVVPLGEDRYRIIIQNKLDVRCAPYAVVEETAAAGVLKFETDALFGEIRDGQFTGGKVDEARLFRMTPAELPSPTLNAKPPRGATILFDGSNMDAWRTTKGWNITEHGTLLVTPGSPDLMSNERFTDMQLHVEFRLPYRPSNRGQDRGNSGVYLQGAYEVQILDSFGLHGYFDECGALYKIAAPKVNACRPPLQWQTYDVTYTGPRYRDDGEVGAYARVTVYHNGVLIHNDLELPRRTGGEDKRARSHPRQAQNLKLQEHEDYIEFRNIWLVEPDKPKKKKRDT